MPDGNTSDLGIFGGEPLQQASEPQTEAPAAQKGAGPEEVAAQALEAPAVEAAAPPPAAPKPPPAPAVQPQPGQSTLPPVPGGRKRFNYVTNRLNLRIAIDMGQDGYRDPATGRWINQKPAREAIFRQGRWGTDDPEEAAIIEASPQFKRGRVKREERMLRQLAEAAARRHQELLAKISGRPEPPGPPIVTGVRSTRDRVANAVGPPKGVFPLQAPVAANEAGTQVALPAGHEFA